VNWCDERYVRLYTRDSTAWKMWCWQARAILPLLLRRMDRAGVLELGGYGLEALVVHLDVPWEVIEPGITALLADGCVEFLHGALVSRNFLEAQEARQSDKARQRESREKRLARARRQAVTFRDDQSQNVTNGHKNGENVTARHTPSHAVTPYRTVPLDLDLNRTGDQKPLGDQNHQRDQHSVAADAATRRGVPPSLEALAVAQYLATAIAEHTPGIRARPETWAREIDLAIRLDRRTPAQLRAAIDWVHRKPDGAFWRANVLSGAKLRKQYDTLAIQAKERRGPASRPAEPTDPLAGKVL